MKRSSEGYKLSLVLADFRMFKMRVVVVLLHYTDM